MNNMNTTLSRKQATIVIIDDDFGIRESLKDMLALENWECAIAASGKEGMDLVRALRPHLVVTDIQLPDMTGFQICQTIKRDTKLKPTPVVMITGRFTEQQDRIQGLELGADEYFSKPFDPRFFVARIKSILRALEPKAA
jgi:two-component system, OmpR family, response regulator AdeR